MDTMIITEYIDVYNFLVICSFTVSIIKPEVCCQNLDC